MPKQRCYSFFAKIEGSTFNVNEIYNGLIYF